jgi:uncharacterized membrane protein YiaA
MARLPVPTRSILRNFWYSQKQRNVASAVCLVVAVGLLGASIATQLPIFVAVVIVLSLFAGLFFLNSKPPPLPPET